MKGILEFVKTYFITILCVLVAIGAVVVGVMGASSDKVVKEMKAEISKTGASSIRSLMSNPKNPKIIEAEKQRGKLFEQEYKRTVAKANAINKRDVLMPGVFPKPAKAATPFKFKEAYSRTMAVLYKQMDADTLPTPAEIQEEEQNIEDLVLLEAEQKAEEQGEEQTKTPVVAGARPGMGRPGMTPRGFPGVGRPGLGPRGAMMPGVGRPGMGRPGMTAAQPGGPNLAAIDRSKPKYNPVYRAQVKKALSILCYYDPDTFHVSPLVDDPAAPPPDQMWYAQVGLWVQQDVVKAIATMNRRAAEAVTQGDPCVENVPIKRLVLLRVRGYEAGGKTGEIPFLARGNVTPPAPEASLTGRKCNEQYDVVRFVVVVVIDQRDLLQLIDEICRTNFYDCIDFNYEAVDQQAARAEGYFYGTAPVVKATYEFEGYMLRQIYQPLMPAAVRTLLGIQSDQ